MQAGVAGCEVAGGEAGEWEEVEEARRGAWGDETLSLDGAFGSALGPNSALGRDSTQLMSRAREHDSMRCVVVLYEADVQMAYLALRGEVDLVISNVPNMLVYGCLHVPVNLDKRGFARSAESCWTSCFGTKLFP